VNARTAVLGVALVVVAVVLLIVLSGGDDSGSDTTTSGSAVNKEAAKGSGGEGNEAEPKPEVTTIVVGKDGKPVGGIAEIDVHKGDEVRFKVESAIAEEIHVHGYDLMKDVPAGGTVTFEFPAELEGIFEAELEGEAEQILELRVEP
jgi:FtsP/CotA-like multicopper oxidase with cupredoxin domain